MKLIAAVDENWGIGYQNHLLVQIPEDMKRFRELTTGQTVLMGKNTFLSLPGQRPLPNRINLILTRDIHFSVPGGIVVHSKAEVWKEWKKHPGTELFVIGGSNVYRQFLHEADEALLTRISGVYPADAYFPDLTKQSSWKLAEESIQYERTEGTYCFQKYVNTKIQRTAE